MDRGGTMPLLEPVQRLFMHQPVPAAEEFHDSNFEALELISDQRNRDVLHHIIHLSIAVSM